MSWIPFLDDKEVVWDNQNRVMITTQHENLKQNIDNFFSEDLKKYVDELGKLEKRILVSNQDDRKQIGDKLTRITTSIVGKANEITAELSNKKVLREIKQAFRKTILPWMGQSEIIRRGLEKPKGYPGDYQTLELIYDNKPISNGIGYFFDSEFLKSELTSAVRNRKDYMVKLLVEFINNSKKGTLKILNLACGSSRDIGEALHSVDSKAKIEFYCLDQDEDALRFSENALKSSPSNVICKFICENVIRFGKNRDVLAAKGFDLIYSIGLADYLPDRIMKSLIKESMLMLNPTGVLIIAHKDYSKYLPVREDWLTDWTFIPRNEETMIGLVRDSGIVSNQIEIIRDPSKIIYFIKVVNSV